MTFLAPAAAAIAAGIALPILAILYALRLRRRPVRVSTTMFWDLARRDLEANVPLRWIRPSWLLFLQTLGLLLLAGALGRPAIALERPPGSRLVVAIDTSASMNAADMPGRRTRLDAAKNRAASIISDALTSSGSRVMVVEFAARARALSGWTTDRAALLEAVNSARATDQPGSIESLSAVLRGVLGEAEDSDASVIIVTDNLTNPADLPARDVRVELVAPPYPGENVGITAIAARRDYEDPATVRVFVRLLSNSPRDAAVPLVAAMNGEVISRRAVRIPAANDGAPAEASTTIEARRTDGGVLFVGIESPDALAADNGASLVLEAASLPGILLVIPNDERLPADDGVTGGSSWLIADVLRELRASRFRAVHESIYEQIVAGDGLEPYGVIVFHRVQPETLPGVPTIAFADSTDSQNFTRILWWDRTHPVMRDVSLDWLMVPAGAHVDRASADLARTRDGVVIALAEEAGVRRIAVAFDPIAAQWPLDASFAVFLANAVEFVTLRASAQAGRSFRTNETVSLQVGGPPRRVPVAGPIEFEADVSPDGEAQLGILELVGIYRVGENDVPVAVNLLDQGETLLSIGSEARAGDEGAARAHRDARELWRWFVVAGLLLLTIEWLLSALRSRV